MTSGQKPLGWGNNRPPRAASTANNNERSFNAALGPLLGSPPSSPADKGWSWNAIGSGIQTFSRAISLLTDEDAGPTALEEKVS